MSHEQEYYYVLKRLAWYWRGNNKDYQRNREVKATALRVFVYWLLSRVKDSNLASPSIVLALISMYFCVLVR